MADAKDGSGAQPGLNASGGKLQTLLFSATMPSWVKDITRRFLSAGHKLVDLVGDDKLKVRLAVLLFSCLSTSCLHCKVIWWSRWAAINLRWEAHVIH